MSFPPDNARSWSQIVAHYEGFLDQPWAVAMHRLTTFLDTRGYVEAGLHGTTSMADLLLGRASDVLNNPRIRIQPTAANIRIAYEDGSPEPWAIEVGFDELCDRVERVLVKRARWFKIAGT